ncbi:MAG: hypothetical protein RR444_11535 [Oscillospiraceae bacterium]
MMLPYQVTMIPLYSTLVKLGAINTFWPLIVPSFFGSAFNVFLLRQFYQTTPNSYLDAARINGWNVFLRENQNEWELLMTASTVFVLPLIVIYFIGQKQFVKGIVMTGLK